MEVICSSSISMILGLSENTPKPRPSPNLSRFGAFYILRNRTARKAEGFDNPQAPTRLRPSRKLSCSYTLPTSPTLTTRLPGRGSTEISSPVELSTASKPLTSSSSCNIVNNPASECKTAPVLPTVSGLAYASLERATRQAKAF
ncbi:phosphotransferases [Striga asiatica]|uniref:Phosphotransferases n=1 Tax=Striga asiatica TaxID=4170 RepID=A0A5A7PLL0_STRAF|nr:phosphotransferases [Striga asiatica]